MFVFLSAASSLFFFWRDDFVIFDVDIYLTAKIWPRHSRVEENSCKSLGQKKKKFPRNSNDSFLLQMEIFRQNQERKQTQKLSHCKENR